MRTHGCTVLTQALTAMSTATAALKLVAKVASARWRAVKLRLRRRLVSKARVSLVGEASVTWHRLRESTRGAAVGHGRHRSPGASAGRARPVGHAWQGWLPPGEKWPG